MKNLYYSEKEKILFYIIGYTDNSNNVQEIVRMLTDGADKLAKLISVERSAINTSFITQSNRYANMRVFYVKTNIIPVNAFMFGNDWTMKTWLSR